MATWRYKFIDDAESPFRFENFREASKQRARRGVGPRSISVSRFRRLAAALLEARGIRRSWGLDNMPRSVIKW